MNTITVLGREYTVETTGIDQSPYTLRGSRGAEYWLFRNKPNPAMLFAISKKGLRLPFDGVWFTDKDGTLRVA